MASEVSSEVAKLIYSEHSHVISHTSPIQILFVHLNFPFTNIYTISCSILVCVSGDSRIFGSAGCYVVIDGLFLHMNTTIKLEVEKKVTESDLSK